MKIVNIFVFFILYTSILLLVKSKQDESLLKQNQLNVFQNQHEAPVMASQIPTANFTAPLLSRALFEEDPERKIRLKEFIEKVRYAMYALTRGEIEQMFTFADHNHDDLLDQKEWDGFSALFILPFEACDTDGNYVLSKAEFGPCWGADPRSKLVKFRRRYEDKKFDLLMRIVSTRGKNEINFSDYLLLRRGLFAWKECHSGIKYIALTAFKCALRIAVPNKYNLKVDIERIYRAGLKLNNDPGMIEMDYISYQRIIYFTYVFSIFNMPHDTPFLEQTQFLKAVREDRFPTNFQESEIKEIYSLTNTNPFGKETKLGYESFVFFYNLHRLFDVYSIQKPLQINEEELGKLLDDELTPIGTVLSIDLSKTDFTEAQYLEVSVILQRLRLNERDFYFSFKSKEKQDASMTTHSTNDPSTINANYYDKVPNIKARHYFFTNLCGIDKRFWNKAIFFRAFQWANLFTEMTNSFDKRWLVSASSLVEKMPILVDTVYPPISQMNRYCYGLFKSIPKEVFVDLLAFITIQNYRYKFDIHKLNSNEVINETLLKIILKDYGMSRMPDTVIDLAKKGYDTLRRRVYVPSEVIKYIIMVQTAAAENVRNNEYIKIFDLKLTDDHSRKFPNFPRRFRASPMV